MFNADDFAARLRQHLAGGALVVREAAPMPAPAPAPVSVTVETATYRWRLTPERDPKTGLMTGCIVEPFERAHLP